MNPIYQIPGWLQSSCVRWLLCLVVTSSTLHLGFALAENYSWRCHTPILCVSIPLVDLSPVGMHEAGVHPHGNWEPRIGLLVPTTHLGRSKILLRSNHDHHRADRRDHAVRSN